MRLDSLITMVVIGLLFGIVLRILHIEIIELEVIERKFGDAANTMIEILKDFKHFGNDRFSNDIRIELVSGDVRISIE